MVIVSLMVCLTIVTLLSIAMHVLFQVGWLRTAGLHIPANSHACGLKTSTSRRLTLAGQFLTPDWKMWDVAVLLDTISKKYVNSDPCKEGKPCVKWINDNTFLAISDFWSEKHWERARVYTRPKTGTRKLRLRQTSNVFGSLRTSSEIFGNDRVVFKNPSTPRIKISRLYLRKSWQVYLYQAMVSIDYWTELSVTLRLLMVGAYEPNSRQLVGFDPKAGFRFIRNTSITIPWMLILDFGIDIWIYCSLNRS